MSFNFAYWFAAADGYDRPGAERTRPGLRIVTDDTPRVESAADRLPHELARRIRDGDHEAFTGFVREHYERAVRVAWAVTGSRDAAQDVVQDVFVRLWERRETLDAGRATAAYVFAATHNRALNEVRHMRVRDRYRDSGQTDTGADGTDADESVLLSADIEAALASLPERWRTALSLRFIAQLSVPEVAAALGISANAGHQLLHRAVKELRRRLGGWAEPSTPPG